MKYKPEKEWIPKNPYEAYKSDRNIARENKSYFKKLLKESTKVFKYIFSHLSDEQKTKFKSKRYFQYKMINIHKSQSIDAILLVLVDCDIFTESFSKTIKRNYVLEKLKDDF